MSQYDSVLKITDILYQQVEQKLSLLIMQRKAIARRVVEIELRVQSEQDQVFSTPGAQFDPNLFMALERWKGVQQSMVENEKRQDSQLAIAQSALMQQLKDIMVKQDIIKLRVKTDTDEKNILLEEDADDTVLSIMQLTALKSAG